MRLLVMLSSLGTSFEQLCSFGLTKLKPAAEALL